MKKTKTILMMMASLIMLVSRLMAQVPQGIPYQAVARDNSGNLIANQNISLRFSIHDVTAAGTVVYKETQTAVTNALGLFSVNIGQGTVVTGTLAGINWGSGAKFIQVEMDATGGITYVNMGTQQMMSVPYALYSGASGSSNNGWSLSGNSGTNPASQFIGTTDNTSLSFRINNLNAGKIAAANGNTFYGLGSGNSVTIQPGNTAIGYAALYSNSIGEENTAVGNISLQDNINGSGNTALGSNTMTNNTSGSYNTASGYAALNSNLTGSENTANGITALYANSTGDNNTASGSAALYNNISGSYNTADGTDALRSNETGEFNTAVGQSSLQSNLAGNNNTAVGNEAGIDAQGSGNLFLGYQAGTGETGSNKLYIANNATSPLIFGDFATGRVGIGTVTPGAALEVNGQVKITGGSPAAGSVLTSDANGLASWQPSSAGQSVAFMSRQTNNITAPPGVYANIPYNNEIFDDANGAAANNYNNATGVFTVPVSGIYHFDVSIAWIGTAQFNPIRYFELIVNGSNSAGASVIRPISQGSNVNMQTSIDLKLNAGDLVQVRVAHNNASGSETVWGLSQYCYFSGHLIN